MSDVSFEYFAQEFKRELDITGNSYLTMSLKEVTQFDSIGKIVISLTIEKLFGFQVSYEVLDKSENIQELHQYCVNRMKLLN
jgi:acyl carrier protein